MDRTKVLVNFATVLSFAGAGIGLFTKFSGLPLLFAAFYLIDRADVNINILPKKKVWRYLLIGLGIVCTLIEVHKVLTSWNPF